MREFANIVVTRGDLYMLQAWGTFKVPPQIGEAPRQAAIRGMKEQSSLTIDPMPCGVIERNDERHHIFTAKISPEAVNTMLSHSVGCGFITRAELLELGDEFVYEIICVAELAKLRDAGRKIGMCHGVFDLLHPGHVYHLEKAKARVDVLLVSVVADEFCEKGAGRPVMSTAERLAMLRGLRAVDFAIATREPSPMELIRECAPHYYIRPEYYRNISTPEDAVLADKVWRIYTPTLDIHSSEIIERAKRCA
jgi:cytidyltransferase-like protein